MQHELMSRVSLAQQIESQTHELPDENEGLHVVQREK